MDGVDYSVPIRLVLPYDCQNPGFSSRIDAMQFGIERHRVGPLADRHAGYDAMLVQVEDCQHGIRVASDEQPAVDIIDRHAGGRLATLQRPTLHNDALYDVDGHDGTAVVQVLV